MAFLHYQLGLLTNGLWFSYLGHGRSQWFLIHINCEEQAFHQEVQMTG